MNLRIRTKFIGILVIAAGLPLLIAVVALELAGHKTFETGQGKMLQNEAWRLSRELAAAVVHQGTLLRQWAWAGEIASRLEQARETLPARGPAEAAALDARWPDLAPDSPELRAVTGSPLADELRGFMALNPSVRELLLTDADGRLVAASGKTTDYRQGDEAWWRRAAASEDGTAEASGVTYDSSAGVYAVEISLPIRRRDRPGGPNAGVVKAVLSVSHIFAEAERFDADDRIARDVAFASGEILARVGRTGGLPGEALPAATAARIRESGGSGWMIGNAGGTGKQIIGFCALPRAAGDAEGKMLLGLGSLHVVAYRDWGELMAPIRAGAIGLGAAALLLTAGFAFAGLLIANRKLLGPIGQIREAARVLARTASLEAPPSRERAGESREILEKIRGIRTGDELEELAAEFCVMADRVIGYHAHLEREIGARTAEIRRDLEFAREFQMAMMPREYPSVGAANRAAGIELRFHHIYRPASSMGGDFCYVLKLSEQRAGVFIADVMGHGSRSALVTAILATLMQNVARRTEDPGRFLELINREFHRVARVGTDPVFATAFYLVLDTGAGVAAFATAGHPPPIVAERSTGAVAPVMPGPDHQPALGLFPESTYRTGTRPLRDGDLFFLFTDGAPEAEDADGQPFGTERMRELIGRNLRRPVDDINGAIVSGIAAFAGRDSFADDLCLVGVEVLSAGMARAGRGAAG